MERKTFLIIDSHALIHRAFHAFPPDLKNAKGEPTNAVYGFAGLLLDVLTKFTPTRVVAVFDSHGPTVRATEYSQYKANRAETDDLLVAQFPMVYELIKMFDIPMVMQDGIEADDLIGTLDENYSNDVMQTVVVTGDRDLLQLVDKDTFVYLAGSKFSESKLYDSNEMVKERMGVEPILVPDLKGLSGDTSDNIPGVAGIGAKGASDLINQFGTIEEIYKKIADVPKRYQQKLIDGHEDAVLSKRLATIYKDIPISFNFENTDFSRINKDNILKFFAEMQFRSLLPKLDKFFKLFDVVSAENNVLDLFSEQSEKSITPVIDIAIWDKNVDLSGDLYFLADVQNANLSPINWLVKDLYIQNKGKVYKVEGSNLAEFLTAVKDLNLITFDKKNFLHCLLNSNNHKYLNLSIQDLGIVAFAMAEGQCKYELTSILNWAKVYSDNSFESRVFALEKLHNFLKGNTNNLKEKTKLIELEDKVLLPTALMEQNGISVDLSAIDKFEVTLSAKLEEFKANIFLSAGHEFNIGSPKQVSEVLFKEKALPVHRKTKGGSLSTNESALKSLIGVDPIIENLLAYREVDKLLSTYIKALPEYVDSDGKIHSVFDQFGAVSGRYSSKNPNLQNIPFTEVYGVNIRNAFIASKGYKFITFDYSQQELRVLAALSKEEVMVDSFNNGVDIHKITAAELFDVKVEDVDSKQRQVGKTVNFSVIYGISAFGLSERLGLNRATADTFIKKYFEKYSKVREFMDNTINSAKQTGYSETIIGRRRINNMIKSNNRALKNAAERELFNFVIQGSAADIMKSSMKLLPPILEKYGAKILLQIHDEFLFEFPEKSSQEQSFIDDISNAMANSLDLGVEYKVEVSQGNLWGEI
jgi:DNA polymerase I